MNAQQESTFVGEAIRVIRRRGRRFDDCVVFLPDPAQRSWIGAPTGGEIRVLTETPIFAADRGPALVVDRVLPVRYDDPAVWIDHAVSDCIPGIRTEKPRRTPLPDTEFWAYVDLLGGEVTDVGLATLTEALSDAPFEQIVAFRDALWEKLHALDHPANTIRDGRGFISADASLYYRCEIVAAGENAYDAAIHTPTPGRADDGAVGEALLTVADDAVPHDLPPATIEIEAGSNTALWLDDQSLAALPSLGPFSPRVQAEANVKPREKDIMRLGFTSFVAYASGEDGHVRELMGCLMAVSFAAAREELESFLRDRLQPGETLDERMLVWQGGAARAMSLSSITGLSRRSSLSMDEYVDLYFYGKLAATS